jgi:crossover junction endodeoxyribonuclease RusA
VTFKIVLPLPPKALSPNARSHWRTKAAATKNYRLAAKLQTRTEMLRLGYAAMPPLRWATECATFYFSNERGRDGDNLLASLKSAFDGIADAGLLGNDKNLTHAPVQQKIDKADPRVEIEVIG